MIRIELRPNNMFSTMDCCICGEEFDMKEITADAFFQGNRGKNYLLGVVCETCFKVGPKMKKHLAHFAERLKRQAGFLEKLSQEEIESPSVRDFEKALAKRRREIFGGRFLIPAGI